MDQLMILRYAYRAALADWDQARVALERNPKSAIQKKREAEADKAFNEIRQLLIAEERKEETR